MKTNTLKSNLLLLLAAAIWGFAFVAQRVGIKYVGPFTFNGVRFALGSLSLVPLILYYGRNAAGRKQQTEGLKYDLKAGVAAGLILYMGASLQQIGLVSTSAGKAAFITGLYIVLVPILGIFLKQYLGINSWLGAIIAVIGLYFLCVTEGFSISRGDLFVLVSAFFWAVHILVIDHFTKKADALKLSCFQFAVCSLLSIATALLIEKITISGLLQAAVPILYGGICSVGIAYTLQVIGQKNAQPSHAAIILSMETVFASIGGWLLLNEDLGVRGYAGCALMLAGMLLAQFKDMGKNRSNENIKAYNIDQ